MRAVSESWNSSIAGSHRILVDATLIDPAWIGFSGVFAVQIGTDLEVADGSVTVDGTAAVRTTLDLTIPGRDLDGHNLWPLTDPSLALAPYGQEIFITRGIAYSEDSIERVALGVFRIDTVEQAAAHQGPLRITGQDRMASIVDARLLGPVGFDAGTTLGTVVSSLVGQIYPDATISWDDATDTTTLTSSIVADQDRYGFLNDLITSRGKIWYWDAFGTLIIKDLPATTDPVYTIAQGRDGVLVTPGRKVTRSGVYNSVVASGTGETPAIGYALDNNPSSPTYFFGNFGQIPMFYSSPLLVDDTACAAAAETLLRKQLGLTYTITLGDVPNPALEPYDSIAVGVGDAGTDPEIHIIDRVTIPLSEQGVMSVETRAQTVVIIGDVP